MHQRARIRREHDAATKPPELSTSDGGVRAADVPSLAREGTTSAGQALDPTTRESMESRFGHSFSQVRVHSDEQAAESASLLNANAYTLGNDIAFASGRYAPQAPEGERLLAHELAHVAQQGSAVRTDGPLAVSAPGDAIERAAAEAADHAVRGERVDVASIAPPGVYGDWGDWFGGNSSSATATADLSNAGPDAATLKAQEEMARFMGQHFEKKNHHPSTGRGLFDAAYDPSTGKLGITLKVCFQFVSGNPADPTWLAAVGAAAAAKFKPEEFVWQASETDAWKAQALADVETAWSEQYTFHNTTPHWETLPNVNVDVKVLDVPAAEAHYVTTIRKWPKDAGVLDAVTPPGTANQSTANFEESADNGITNPDVDTLTTTTLSQPQYAIVDTDNPGIVSFQLGSSEVQPADAAKLQKFAKTLARPEIPPFPITLTAHASSEGSDESNLKLSEDRGREVANILVREGAKTQPLVVPRGEAGAAATAAWRRVVVSVGDFVSKQETVKHEFGHMLGLGDEYANPGSGRAAGTPVAHSALAQRLIPGQQPIVATDNDNIMSVGQTILPHHYVTFLEVLGIMSKSEGQWSIGPGLGAPPRGKGDYPTPSGPNQTA